MGKGCIGEKPGGPAGFTMVEVMFAITLFAIGLLAVAGMLTGGIVGTDTASRHSETSIRAGSEIERILALSYDHADLVDGGHGPVAVDSYVITWTVTEGVPLNSMKEIVITVQETVKGKQSGYTYYRADL